MQLARTILLKALLTLTVLAAAPSHSSVQADDQLQPIYAATMVVHAAGSVSAIRLWAANDKTRLEMDSPSGTAVLITEYPDQRCWVMLPGMHHFHAFPLHSIDQTLPPLFASVSRLEKQPLTRESINGKAALKHRVRITAFDRTWEGFLWEDETLPGYPLRWEDEKGTLKVSWTNGRLIEPAGRYFKIITSDCTPDKCTCPNAINGKPCGKKNFRWKFHWEK